MVFLTKSMKNFLIPITVADKKLVLSKNIKFSLGHV